MILGITVVECINLMKILVKNFGYEFKILVVNEILEIKIFDVKLHNINISRVILFLLN